MRQRITEVTSALDRTYGWSLVTEFLVLALLLLVLKVAAGVLTEEGFGRFMVMRSTLTVAFPVALLGLAVALPRYVAGVQHDESARIERLWSAAVLLLLTSLVFIGVIFGLFPRTVSTVLFGDSRHSELALPFVLMLSGFCLHVLTYSLFRGRLLMGRANFLQVLNTSVVPLAALLATRAVPDYFVVVGAAWMATSLATMLAFRLRLRTEGLLETARELLPFGIRRMPGDFFLVGLVSLPVTLSAHLEGIFEAGLVSVGITIITVVGAALAPLGIVLLPRASRALASADIGSLRKEVAVITGAVTAVSILLVPIVLMFSEPLIRLLLSASVEEAAARVPMMVVAIWPYGIFIVLRNVIDAFHTRAVNGRNGGIALAILLLFGGIALGVTESVTTVLVGFDLAMVVLGLLTLYEVWLILKVKPALGS